MCSILSVPAFLVTISYHTPYARPWVYPPAAFWLGDLVLRMVRGTWVGQVELSVQGDVTVVSHHYAGQCIVPLTTLRNRSKCQPTLALFNLAGTFACPSSSPRSASVMHGTLQDIPLP